MTRIAIIKNLGVNTENCFDMNGSEAFRCECNGGFEGRRCEISVCEGIVCENGFCNEGKCLCDFGYIKISENICVESCETNPCKELG